MINFGGGGPSGKLCSPNEDGLFRLMKLKSQREDFTGINNQIKERFTL